MRAVSALLVLAVAGLVTVGVVKIRHGYDLTGAGLIGWAFVPLAVALSDLLCLLGAGSKGLAARHAATGRTACYSGARRLPGTGRESFWYRLGLEG